MAALFNILSYTLDLSSTCPSHLKMTSHHLKSLVAKAKGLFRQNDVGRGRDGLTFFSDDRLFWGHFHHSTSYIFVLSLAVVALSIYQQDRFFLLTTE